jgi:phage terminase large subunit-like protein
MILMVPPEDEAPWPTLGAQVCQYIEANLVFGPGDLLGKPAKLDPEKRALIYSFYEVHPEGTKDANGKSIAGRRRFRRCGWSTQKGSAKTELAAWIAACELAPDAPVRCDGFSNGRPIGRPVIDPYIPMVAYTEEQTSDLAYGALYAILDESPIRHLFDIGLERILRAGGNGKAVALAGAPDSRDGARTTFSHKDETHRWNSERLRRAHRTMIANLPKRLLADPWELETTTAFSPGENSVAEQTMEYAVAVATGAIKDSRLFYFHRQASDGYDVRNPDELRRAVLEAAGPTAAWKDIDGICDLWQDPSADLEYLERVYLNRPVATASQAFDSAAWREHAAPGFLFGRGQLITLGFDGSETDDATALIATHVATGFQWPIGIWTPSAQNGWRIPKLEVSAAVDAAFETFNVWRMYYDPSKWETLGAEWQGRHGEKVVVEWPTVRVRQMATALKAYATAIRAGEVFNSGDEPFARHIGNAQKTNLNIPDDDGQPLWLIHKDRPMSPNKIDAAMAGCLSWQARLDAIAAGVLTSSTVMSASWA